VRRLQREPKLEGEQAVASEKRWQEWRMGMGVVIQAQNADTG
jgi:hypothetical protein